ncbi:thiol-disulfide isomerase-like protein [Catenovulum agarivorans DS-2]|uniref:Thiol-disulfide isomerase-like protein n=1 Tax=Catenovulum agarivorans DS-2 TaxID=1328313 RepID=W7R369_9ALTE|nr:thioredoxin family protein [Catenovulum agarivorans]EWH12075.1 thiol-disulfide isomerase-like protein [Catenovulum agarivorans DS-2]
MKVKQYLSLAALAFISCFARAEIHIDAIAPNFSLTNEQGQTVSLSDYQGKYVVLEWTNHQCPYVEKHYNSGNMQSLQKKYTDDGVVWLSIISSAPGKQGHVSSNQAIELTQSRNAAPTHVLFDPSGNVGKLYGAKTTPHMYIIDKQGKLRYAGGIDSIKSANPADIKKAVNYVEQGLSALMSGQTISNKLTPPYGCSVKYKS